MARKGWTAAIVHGCAEIPLSRGLHCVIDLCDLHLVSAMQWSALKTQDGNLYAFCSSANVLMHRVLLKCGPSEKVDHINLDGLDNRQMNLRAATNTQNSYNRLASKNSKTGVKGVSWCAERGKYVAAISINGKQTNLGRYASMDEAAAAYAGAAARLHGEFLNIQKVER